MLRVSLRNQLLLAPETTVGGTEYPRLPGTPCSAWLIKVCMPGEATNTPSEPYTITCLLSRTSPTQIAAARSGVKATVTASLKLSVVPVFAATVRFDQCSALLQPKIMQRFASADMVWAMIKATAA